MQIINLYIGTSLYPVEDVVQDALLPALFNGDTYQIPGRAVTSLPVKQAGIDIPDPTQTEVAKWTESCVITEYLVAAFRGTAEFWSGDHYLFMGEGRGEISRRHAEDG